MLELLKPVKTESLKEACSGRLEDLILSGRLPIGQKLPSERELALQLCVSRPVAHEALVDLAWLFYRVHLRGELEQDVLDEAVGLAAQARRIGPPSF